MTTEELVERINQFVSERESKDISESNPTNWALRKFRDHVVGVPFEVHMDGVIEYVRGLKKNHKPSSVQFIALSIRRFFNWLHERGYADEKIVTRYPRGLIKVPRRDAVVFTDEDYKEMLDKSMGTNWYPLIVIGWNTGMRISDCALLTWDEVDLRNKIVKKMPKKTERLEDEVKVEIPMSDQLFELLYEMNELRCDGKYVLRRLAIIALVGNGNISTHFRDWQKREGLYESGKTFHAFRRTAISNWLSHPNADIVTVQHLSGHRSIRSLLRYINPSNEKKRLIMGIK